MEGNQPEKHPEKKQLKRNISSGCEFKDGETIAFLKKSNKKGSKSSKMMK
ncbi:hypothetical protein SOVF_068920 [Spinacia oleracea]|nr:hypothetical protein SOVF_068920 [Spinacia oleracea]